MAIIVERWTQGTDGGQACGEWLGLRFRELYVILKDARLPQNNKSSKSFVL